MQKEKEYNTESIQKYAKNIKYNHTFIRKSYKIKNL